MKLKLLFLLVIVYVSGCARKTFNGPDRLFYKEEMEKARRLQEQKDTGQVGQTAATGTKPGTPPTYLSKEDRTKFARILGIKDNEIENEKLYHTINKWLGVPYLWGGTTKRGVDCSAFVQHVYKDVYGQQLPRTSIEQFYLNTKAQFKGQKYLKQGDLVFFRLRHKDKIVSHVGIYLQNGKFLGSNSPRGVEIVDLNDDYWQDKYVASARLLNKNN